MYGNCGILMMNIAHKEIMQSMATVVWKHFTLAQHYSVLYLMH